MSDHHPAVRARDGEAVGDGFGIRGADADVDDGDAALVVAKQVVRRHLRGVRVLTANSGSGDGADVVALPTRARQRRVPVRISGSEGGGVFEEHVRVQLVVGK